MGFLDRLFGRREEPPMQPAAPTYDPGSGGQQRLSEADEQALQRYRYMLRTAPPETIEQAHEEAFAKLTPAQRAQTLRELAGVTPENEREALAGGRDDPKSLARLATRAEMRQPGVMERIFGGTSRGPSMGGMMGGMGGTLLGSLAAGFVGSMIAQEFLGSVGGFGEGDTSGYSGDDSGEYGSGDSTSDDSDGGSDYGSDDSGGYSDADSGGYGDDLGGDTGSDWGGGDWGGGDFGGGEW